MIHPRNPLALGLLMMPPPSDVCASGLRGRAARHFTRLALSVAWGMAVASSALAQNVSEELVFVAPICGESFVSQRGPHHKEWSRVITVTDADGVARRRTNLAFIELGTGMHRLEGGQWVEARAIIEPFAHGAVARQGQHKVIFAPDLATAGAVDMETPEGKRLRGHVLGLAYYDAASAQHVILAEVRSATGQIVNGNQVIYPDGFTGIRADVRYTYTVAGLEQDVILRERPPAPEKFGLNPATTRLQVLTEFLAPPEPVKRAGDNRNLEPGGLVDEYLDFGAMHMIEGRAFPLGEEDGRAARRVFKRWLRVGDRQILIEELPLPSAAEALHSLPARADGAALPQPLTNRVTAHLRLPSAPALQLTETPMQVAEAGPPEPGFVLDYIWMGTSGTNYVFRADTTYYVSGQVSLDGQTVIEGGTVLKFGPDGGLWINGVNASLSCQTGPYRMGILTSKDDDTVGEILPMSKGNPSVAGTYLIAADAIRYLRFVFADTAWRLSGYPGQVEAWHCQFINGNEAVFCYNPVRLFFYNCLFDGNQTVANGCLEMDLQHVTIRGGNLTLPLWNDGWWGTGNFINSLLVGVTVADPAWEGWDGSLNWQNSFLLTSDTGVFSPAGAGRSYLAANSPYHDQGTLNVHPTLLAELCQKTTHPPQIITARLPGGTVLTSPAVPRDSDVPDLGYHYDPLDYCVSNQRGTSAWKLTLGAGTALGFFGGTPFLGGTVESFGTADRRNRVAHYTAVQEQPLTWGANAAATYLSSSVAFRWRFTDLSLAGGVWLYTGTPKTFDFKDCSLLAANLTVGCLATTERVALTNNLFTRCWLDWANFCGNYPVTLRNNLFLDSTLKFYPGSYNAYWYPLCRVADNLFVRSHFGYTPVQGYGPVITHNAYYQTTTTNQGTAPFSLLAVDFQSGPLGDYYYPSWGGDLGQLVGAGSVSAASVGLADYTVLPDQTPDGQWGTGQVSVGYHYLPVVSQWGSVCLTTSTPPATPVGVVLDGPGCCGGPQTFAITDTPDHGSLGAITQLGWSQAITTYTPNAGYEGLDYFSYAVANCRQPVGSGIVWLLMAVPPALTAACGPDRILLQWTVSAYVRDHAVDFLIKRATSPGGPYTVIHTASANERDYTDTAVTPGVAYCYLVVPRIHSPCGTGMAELPPSNEVCSGTCACVEPVISGWRFTDQGIIGPQKALNGTYREYEHPTEVEASPWSLLSANNRDLRFDFEDDKNCADHNPNRQEGSATAKFYAFCSMQVVVSWYGQGEQFNAGYDLLRIMLDSELVGSAQSLENEKGCGFPMVPVQSSPSPPIAIDLTPGWHELRIEVDSRDAQYHTNAFYELGITFLPGNQ